MTSVGGPIVWRLHLRSSPERVFSFLDTDRGRTSFWSEESVAGEDGFTLGFTNGITAEVRILDRRPPWRLECIYFGSRVVFELEPDGDGGTDLTVTNSGVEPSEWVEVHAGWLNVLLPLKAAVDFGVDLRSHDPTRSWNRGYVDP